MHYEVAIPSYCRPRTLTEKTLAIVEAFDIPADRVTIFVANEAEERQYKAVVPREYKIVMGVLGIGPQRNFIQKYYPEKTPLVMLDDDLQELGWLSADGTCLNPVADLDLFIQKAFLTTIKNHARLWGIYPVYNHFFMDHRTVFCINYINGAFMGMINTHDPRTFVELEDKEDFERSIRWYILDGKVVRFNFIAMKTNYYTEPGGMQETRTPERVRDSALHLLKKYPDFCEFNPARKKHFEVKLVDKRKRNER